MTLLVLLVGIFILGTCLAFFVSPSLVEELIVWLGRQRNLYAVVALRLIFGLLLVVGAPQTHYPSVIAALGYLFIAAAVLLAVLPAAKIRSITEYFLDRSHWVVRAWVLLPMALGIFIICSVL